MSGKTVLVIGGAAAAAWLLFKAQIEAMLGMSSTSTTTTTAPAPTTTTAPPPAGTSTAAQSLKAKIAAVASVAGYTVLNWDQWVYMLHTVPGYETYGAPDVPLGLDRASLLTLDQFWGWFTPAAGLQGIGRRRLPNYTRAAWGY
jgi:hypothetical protein